MAGSRSLTLAVRDQLRATAHATNIVGYGLGIASSDCDVTFDGRPNPDCGKLFFAVHHGRRTNQLLTGDESMFSVSVTISGRANEPFDRIGPNLLDWANGVMAWGDRVWACLFGNQWGVEATPGVMYRANRYLPPSSYPWTEALYPTSMSEAQPVRPDWFSATEDQGQPSRGRGSIQPQRGNTVPFVGLTIRIELTGAKRIQRLDDIGA